MNNAFVSERDKVHFLVRKHMGQSKVARPGHG